MSISINRLTYAWFEYNGTRSDELDVYITQMPVREIPARQVTRTKVAGRSGTVRFSDNSYDDITIDLSFKCLNSANLHAINAWLTGAGSLRFSDEPDFVYNAVIERPPVRQSENYRFDVQTYDVTFVCHPFKTLYDPAEDVTFTAPGTLTNPGTAPAQPRVKITGSGTFSVTLGTRTMFFHGVTDGVIVDSELGDVLTYDGLLLANNNASGELFQLDPGGNAVSWVNGGIDDDSEDDNTPQTGTVSSIVITPRWRYL